MMLRRSMAVLMLTCAAAIAVPVPVQAQVAATHEVLRGDTLFAIARKAKHEGVSRNQMILAIWRANPSAFVAGNINLIEVGTILVIPARETVAAIGPAEANQGVGELLAGRPAETIPVPALSLKLATQRYEEGLALERKGDDQGALTAFLEAGASGHGLAQRKLGQIYDKGNSAVQRDLQTSILWYQKARAQGVPLDKNPPRILPK